MRDARCDSPVHLMGALLSNRLFGQIILFYFFVFNIFSYNCVYVWTDNVTDNQREITDCMTAISINTDLPFLTIWPICMIIICIYNTSACDY